MRNSHQRHRPPARGRLSRRGLLLGAATCAASLWACVPATGEPTPRASATIALPEPTVEGTVSVERALATRRSVRSYADAPLTLPKAGQILWAAQGVTDPRGYRTAPSAGALYPLETYLVAGSVEGLDPGVYLYDPAEHALQPVAPGDRREELTRAALGQSFLRRAPASVVLAAVAERTTGKYGLRGHQYVHMEAGHAAENVYLQCVALDLGTVAVGAFDDAAVARALGLPSEVAPLYILAVGKR